MSGACPGIYKGGRAIIFRNSMKISFFIQKCGEYDQDYRFFFGGGGGPAHLCIRACVNLYIDTLFIN